MNATDDWAQIDTTNRISEKQKTINLSQPRPYTYD